MAHITVETDNGTLDLELRLGDIRRFEKEYGLTLADLQVPQGEPVPANLLDKILFLAWCSAKRSKHTDLPFDDWCDTIAGMGSIEADPLERSTNESQKSLRSA